jgi:DNA-binding XRE family transcriptional regulator
MRSFLIDRARRRLVRQRVDEEHSRRAIQAADEDGFDSTHFSSDIALQLPELLEELRTISVRQAMVFELRAIKGLSVAQAAASLGLGRRPEDRLRAELGRQIRIARTERAWTLKDLSEASGVSVSQLSSIERSAHLPSLESLVTIAGALDRRPSTWLDAAGL